MVAMPTDQPTLCHRTGTACWGDVERDEALVDLEELDSLIERPHLICRGNPTAQQICVVIKPMADNSDQ
jgi:hypothetical protein